MNKLYIWYIYSSAFVNGVVDYWLYLAWLKDVY